MRLNKETQVLCVWISEEIMYVSTLELIWLRVLTLRKKKKTISLFLLSLPYVLPQLFAPLALGILYQYVIYKTYYALTGPLDDSIASVACSCHQRDKARV